VAVELLVPKKNVIMDATLLSSLMSCGRYHDLRFNHRLVSQRGRSNSLEVGSLIHKVLEVFYQHQIKGFPRAECIGAGLTAGQMFVIGCPKCAGFVSENDSKPECGHDIDEYPGVTNTPEQSVKFEVGWRFALDTCQQYFDFYKNDSFIPLACETVKGEIMYEDDEIRVLWKAKLDLVIDNSQIGIVSMDHKTFKQRRDKSTLSNQFLGQCLLLKARNVIVNKIGLQTTLKIDERLTREVISFSADRLIEWQQEILPYYAYKYIQYSESEYWPPDYTHCDTMYGPCAYKQVCEADRGMREEVLRNNYVMAPVWDPRNKGEDG
jgi:PD-(D/E)XK nuclease superfamily